MHSTLEPSGAPPPWLVGALADQGERGEVDVQGVPIAFHAWGPVGRPGAILVHGGAGNAAWWDHIGPMLTSDGRRVVALDLSGHGDSGRRSDYSLERWGAETLAVAAAAGVNGPPILVGHSMGGSVVLAATQGDGDGVGGAIVIDSVVRPLTGEEHESRVGRVARPLRRYPSRAEATARFRPIPDQGRPLLPAVVDHVAMASVRPDGDSWVWKFDPLTYQRTQLTPEALEPVDQPLALVRAEFGRMTRESSAQLRDRLGGRALEVEIPDSGHHIMLERPLALVVTLRTILSAWAVS